MGKRKRAEARQEPTAVQEMKVEAKPEPAADQNLHQKFDTKQGTDEPVGNSGVADIEVERARLIARNRARMIALGIPLALDTLSKLTIRQGRSCMTIPLVLPFAGACHGTQHAWHANHAACQALCMAPTC